MSCWPSWAVCKSRKLCRAMASRRPVLRAISARIRLEPPVARHSPGPGIVAHRMGRDWLGDAAPPMGALTGLPHRVAGDRTCRVLTRKGPRRRPTHAPPVAPHRQQLRGQHHVPIQLALPLFDADHHPATVDIGRPEVDGFRDTQAGGVAGCQDRPRRGARDIGEKWATSSGLRTAGKGLGFSARGSRP